MGSEPIVIAAVQARMGSTRLPGKVLMDLAGSTVLGVVLDRVARAGLDATVVATSVEPIDDPIVLFAQRAGAKVVRGSETDVLSRMRGVLDAYPADHIVRITADCPLVDPQVVRDVVRMHLRSGADYTSNTLPRTFPKGLDVEVVSAAALRVAAAESTDPEEREHVMPFLYRRPERFRLMNLLSGHDLGDERWTVDTPEDLDRVRSILDRAGPDPVRAGWLDLLASYGPHVDRTGLRLRPATSADCDRLLNWRNDPVSVANSLSGAEIDPREHRRWLDRHLVDPGCRLRIVELDEEPVGMLRVDVRGGRGTVSIVIAPESRGRGVGTEALRLLLRELSEGMQVTSLVADVVVGNQASLRMFRSAGFTVESESGRSVHLASSPRSAWHGSDPEV